MNVSLRGSIVEEDITLLDIGANGQLLFRLEEHSTCTVNDRPDA
jgi:hypothetical protein